MGDGLQLSEANDLRDLRAVVYSDLLHGTFRGLTFDDWKVLLDVADSIDARADQVVLRQGMTDQGIFIVADGMVRVERVESDARQSHLAVLGVGEVFGEMSFLESCEASASVIAISDSELVHIDSAQVTALLEADTDLAARFYRALALTLSDRLRRTSTLV